MMPNDEKIKPPQGDSSTAGGWVEKIKHDLAEQKDWPDETKIHEVEGFKVSFAGDLSPDIGKPGLIDGVLESKAMTVLYGPSGSGKTAVAVDMAARIAAGIPWRGYHTTQVGVLYIAAENATSTNRRIIAWSIENGVKRSALPLLTVQSKFSMVQGAVDRLAKLITWANERPELHGHPIQLVVIDTLARAMEGDENSQKDMGQFVALGDEIKDGIGGHLLIVHHTGKDESRGARGSSALRAATDHELETFKTSEGSLFGGLIIKKVREGGLEGATFGYELTPVGLAENTLERMVDSVVAVPTENAPKKGGQSRRKRDEDADRIREWIEQNGPASRTALKKHIQLRPNAQSNTETWSRYFNAENGFLKEDPNGLVAFR